MFFRQLVREAYGCASYIIGSEEGGVCAVVDPLMDSERFFFELKASKLKPVLVLETHTHADHLSGAREFAKMTGANLYLSGESKAKFSFNPIEDGGKIDLHDVSIKAIHTPGHTYDHMSILINEQKLLSGDTLLIGDVGMTDLGGNSEALYRSLHEKILKLPDGITVHPAHVGAHHYLKGGTSSTIGAEKQTNAALKVKSKEEFLRYMEEGWPPKPEGYEAIIAINLGKKSLLKAQSELLKVGGRMGAKKP